MSESSKVQAARNLTHAIRRASEGCYPLTVDTMNVVQDIIDAAKDELRAELDAGIKARAPQDAAARPAPDARVTCQCREPMCG